MSDTARAKILDRGACLHPGPRENWPCAICIQERITAYAAEQTAGLRARLDVLEQAMRQGCCLVAVHRCHQAEALAAVDRLVLLTDPEGQQQESLPTRRMLIEYKDLVEAAKFVHDNNEKGMIGAAALCHALVPFTAKCAHQPVADPEGQR